MGAEFFYGFGEGETIDKAFRNLVKEAKLDYGRRGYTGTIAEKDSYHLWNLSDEIAYLKKLVDNDGIPNPIVKTGRTDPDDEDLEEEAWVCYKSGITEFVNNLSNLTIDEQAEEVAGILGADLGDRRFADKWGPAHVFQVGSHRWLFFGWASA